MFCINFFGFQIVRPGNSFGHPGFTDYSWASSFTDHSWGNSYGHHGFSDSSRDHSAR